MKLETLGLHVLETLNSQFYFMLLFVNHSAIDVLYAPKKVILASKH